MISTSKKKLQILKEKKLCDFCYDDVIVFNDFAQALIGVSYDNRAIYSYSQMIKILMKKGYTEDEAIDFIDYNVCSFSCGEGMPIVMTFEIYKL